jgi:outer membrane protein assembly factor BamB
MLTDASFLAVDGYGRVVVAESTGGRINVFDADGKLIRFWQIGTKTTWLTGVTVSQDGIVFVSDDHDLYRYDEETGKLLGTVPFSDGPMFVDLTNHPESGIVAAWQKWPSNEDNLVWFDSDGKILRTVKNFISDHTDDNVVHPEVVAAGTGEVYALNDGDIFHYTAEGKYDNHFLAKALDPDLANVRAIGADSQDRLYLSRSKDVIVVSPDGQLIKTFSIDLFPEKIFFGPTGDMYVLDGSQVVRYTLGDLP